MKNKNPYRDDERMNVLKRAAISGEIEIRENGWGLNETFGAQGEWISPTIIQEWVRQGLLTVKDGIGTITEKGERGEYVE
jgi:hypothetical protein